METVVAQLLQRLHKANTAVAFASKARRRKKENPSSQQAWFGVVGNKYKKITQSVSVQAADKQVLGFPKLKRHGCPRALARMKQTPLLCERFRDGSILLFWALTSRSEEGYDSAACGEK